MSTATQPLWTLGELMEKARRDARVSTAEMALYFGVHRKTINNWEAGRTNPSRADLRVWADRCNQPWFSVESLPDLLGNASRWIIALAGQHSLFEVPAGTQRDHIAADEAA